LRNYQLGIPDPAPIPSFWVFVIKAVGTILAAVALWLTVRGNGEKRGTA
jgi:hypothetical protein